MPTLRSHTHLQAAQANAQTKACKRVCLPKRRDTATWDKGETTKKEGRTRNMGLAKVVVQCSADIFVGDPTLDPRINRDSYQDGENRHLRQAQNRYRFKRHQKPKIPQHTPLAAKTQNIRRKNAANNPYIYRKFYQPMANYIYEYENWTNFKWQDQDINIVFGEVRYLQGKIIGQMNALGFSEKEEATLRTLTLDVVKSSEIEGELLNYDQVRSSIARRLGINTAGLVPSSRHIEGVVEMMLDATQRHTLPLTEARLFGWHAALFPTGYSGPYKIEVGQYRTSEIQVVSGAMGKEKVHYEAVKPEMVKVEMDQFLDWFNNENRVDPVLKAAIAHFWFIIIHPFDDGNGRIGRAITDMLLARSEGSGERFYSMSSQILAERKRYYAVLQKVQHSTGDITEWLDWFLHCLKNAMLATEGTMQKILRKSAFWKLHEHTAINERQRLMLNKLFDGFEGKLQTSKWAKITKTSSDTALRDIKDLVEKGILQPTPEGGRNANYELVDFNVQ